MKSLTTLFMFVAACLLVLLIMGGAQDLFGQGLLTPLPRQQFLTNAGAVCASCTLTFSLTGTATPTSVYSDETLMTAVSNPLTLDSSGRPATGLFLSPTISYRFVLKTSAGVTIWTQDNVKAAPDTAISLTAGFIPKADSAGTNLEDSCLSVSGTTITSTCTAGFGAQRTRMVPDVAQDLIVSSGQPIVVVIGTSTVAVALSSGTASAVTTNFQVPVDAVVTGSLTLRLTYSASTAPGVTNNKVKLTVACTVNATATATTAGDTITLANNTTPASYTGTLNICAGSTYAAGDFVSMTIARDVTVTNNAVVDFRIRNVSVSYLAANTP